MKKMYYGEMSKLGVDDLSKEDYQTTTNFINEELNFIVETLQKKYPQLSERDIMKLIIIFLKRG